jgi:hypothetical protein
MAAGRIIAWPDPDPSIVVRVIYMTTFAEPAGPMALYQGPTKQETVT